MISASHVKAEPFFLEGPNGRLFAVYHPPQQGVEVKGCFLYVQPFAEEMNRCRQMVSLQAREFSKLGYGCLLLDLYGTGDSEGEYQEGTWDIYQADLRTGLQWISSKGYTNILLWAVRHGALLALELACSMPPPHRLLFWQPVLNGQTALTQILRIEFAASLTGENKVSMDNLRKQIHASEIIELSGYQTAGSFLTALEASKVSNYYKLPEVEVHWFDVLSSEGQNPARARTMVEHEWKNAGAQVHYETVVGPAFWQVWERVIAGTLIDQTSAWARQSG